MSWEGFYQQLCKKGHYTSQSAEYQDSDIKCSLCGEKIVWVNTVDTTNGSHEGNKRIDGYVDLKVDKNTKCKECGHTLELTYKIPGKRKR
jgi:hypothetical protein